MKKSASWKITCHNLWLLLVGGVGAHIPGWNWCWLPRWLKVKILHQQPRSWCDKEVTDGFTPNQHTKWLRNDSKEWATNITWYLIFALIFGEDFILDKNVSELQFRTTSFLLIGVYPSKNQQGIQIQQGNHFATLCFWLSCHFLLHEGREICETFVSEVLGDFSEKLLVGFLRIIS